MINAVIVVGTRQNQVQKNKEGTDQGDAIPK